jgi:hypothetical protein
MNYEVKFGGFDFSYHACTVMFKWVQYSFSLGELTRVYIKAAILFVTLVAFK